jgi:hypothetical protein
VLWDATLHQDGLTWECQVVHISPGGVKIRIDQRLAIKSRVVIAIERLGSFPSEVRWQDENLVGDPLSGRRWCGPSAFAWLSGRAPCDLAELG